MQDSGKEEEYAGDEIHSLAQKDDGPDIGMIVQLPYIECKDHPDKRHHRSDDSHSEYIIYYGFDIQRKEGITSQSPSQDKQKYRKRHNPDRNRDGKKIFFDDGE
jgi:hypothetical protein